MKIKAKWNKMMKEIERLAEYLDEVNEDNY
jgi:hypothetical protein